MELKYLREQDVETPEYITFYEKYHGDGSFQQRRERIHWYFKSEAFRLLTAIVDGKYAGQSCAFKVTAIVYGFPMEWWWGIDSFVLIEMRGKGIGKALQKKLHEDCPNFSSASYSSINGIIKKKCGGREALAFHQYYCPVSCYATLYAELALKKMVGRKITVPRLRLPYFYSSLNGKGGQDGYSYRVFTAEDFDEQLSCFMEEGLKDTDFHIERSVAYLKWKYLQNPSIRFVGLEITKDGEREGVILFSEAYSGKFTISKAKVSKIFDSVIRQGSTLTLKMMLATVIRYFKDKGVKLDGILTLIPSDYKLQIQYPVSQPLYMLSSIDEPLMTNGYLSYSDQDMEQMYES